MNPQEQSRVICTQECLKTIRRRGLLAAIHRSLVHCYSIEPLRLQKSLNLQVIGSARVKWTAEARPLLERAARAIEQDEQQRRDDPSYAAFWWGDRLAGQLLRREAEALIPPAGR